MRTEGLAARIAPYAPPVAAFLTGFAFIAANALRVRDWAVMTDELLYSKLAIAVATTGSPIPEIHGEYYGALAQLYPLLLVPLYAVFDAPTAFRAAHGLNAALMASAAVPTYVLARTVVPRAAAAVVALAAVVTPWALLAGFVMTEAVAYPAFAWAILAMHAALTRPSRRRDALVLAALAVAFFARTQFLALAVVLPLAIVAHEAGLAAIGGGSPRRAARATLGRVVNHHPVLVLAYAVVAVGAFALAATGSLDAVLGTYAVTATEGSILPDGVWTAAAAHLVAVAIGLGVLPLLLAAAWALATVVRSRSVPARSLAVLALLTVAVLSLQVASYDLRFGETDLVRDRYLFYVVPLILIAAAAALLDRPPHALLLAATAAAFALIVRAYDFPVLPRFTVDSPVALLNERIAEIAGDVSAKTFTGAIAILLVVVLIAARSLVPRTALAATVLGATVAFGAAAAQDVYARVLDRESPSGRSLAADPGMRMDWVDSALPADARAGIVPFPVEGGWEVSAVRWWDLEFWNRTVVRALVGPGRAFSYTPFPVAALSVDWETGRVRTEAAEAFVVVATQDARFRLAGPRRAARAGLELLEAERPHRAEWVTRGVDPDGWLRPERAATLRVFSRPGAGDELAALDIALRAPAAGEATFVVTWAGAMRTVTVARGGSALERVELCMPAGQHADLSLASARAARIPGVSFGPEPQRARDVGVRVDAIVLQRGGVCTPG